MAELLIFTRDNTHPDPEKDRRGCYKRGMVVSVMPDGHPWGIRESKQAWIAAGNSAQSWNEPFAIIKLPGVPLSKARAVIEAQTEGDAGTPLVDGNGVPIPFRRRRWRLLVDSIPTAVRNQLLTNGEFTATLAQVRGYIKRVRDNAQFVGLD